MGRFLYEKSISLTSFVSKHTLQMLAKWTRDHAQIRITEFIILRWKIKNLEMSQGSPDSYEITGHLTWPCSIWLLAPFQSLLSVQGEQGMIHVPIVSSRLE